MNGRDRNISQFRKLSAYIMQDNQLHGNLTVEEAMTVAANLKLSAKVPKKDKSIVVSMRIMDISMHHGDHRFSCETNFWMDRANILRLFLQRLFRINCN